MLVVNVGENERLFMCEDKNCPINLKECKVIQDKNLSKPMFCIHSKKYQCDFHEMNWMQIGNAAVLISHKSKIKTEVKDGNFLYISMEFKNEGDNENKD